MTLPVSVAASSSPSGRGPVPWVAGGFKLSRLVRILRINAQERKIHVNYGCNILSRQDFPHRNINHWTIVTTFIFLLIVSTLGVVVLCINSKVSKYNLCNVTWGNVSFLEANSNRMLTDFTGSCQRPELPGSTPTMPKRDIHTLDCPSNK